MEISAKSLEAYAIAAMQAGCPRDQVERFIGAGYVATPKQLEFHALARAADKPGGPTDILCGGARGGAKSHAIIAQVGIDDCQRYPGLKCLFLRQTQKAASESFQDLVRRVLVGVPHRLTEYKIEFPNGSRVVIGGYKDPKDIEKYIGIEYDMIVIEELTQIPGDRIDLLMGSRRTSRSDGWRPRTYASTNPGGVGHADVKAKYIIPYRSSAEALTRFVPMTYRDNPFLNPEYKTWLENLTGPTAKAWRDGDWDVFEGQAFPAWNEERHVIKGRFDIPSHWLRVRGVDWGYTSPFACLWGAINPDNGRVILYRELYATQLTDRQQATQIAQLTGQERIAMTYADPSMFTKRTQDLAVSTADIYAANGVYLTPADNDRLSGKRKIDRLLGDMQDGLPGLMVHESLTEWRRSFPLLIFDDKKPEDIDTDTDDHLYDACRYLLTSAREATPPRKAQPNPWLAVKGI